MTPDKTVYILGAGFSMDAGAPSQAAIIKEIFELRNAYPTKYRKTVHGWVDIFEHFLTKSLHVDDSNKNWYSLEDIYTPIDKSISEGTSFREYTVNDLIDLRDTFNKLIILAVRNAISSSKKKDTSIQKFARHLVEMGKNRLSDEKDDRVAVITTNWDILLDNTVNRLINDEPIPKGHHFSGVVDYCCHISSLDENDHRVKPGLYALGKGRYNVKFLKLHGSLNWLQCPKCLRIYVKFYRTWSGGYVFDEKHCRHCSRNFKADNNKSNQLLTNLVMPTYLKDLKNVQHKVIWQNAGIELSEASKVVFLGYSLPQADFELKQLLSRMIRSDAKVDVVLIDNDNPNNYEGNSKYQTAGFRFQNFFSDRELNISYDGVAKYIENL
jgi:NAD-dependent SIR2 family protein deacetylase